VFAIDGEWTDGIFDDFATLPAELGTKLAYTFYSVQNYNRTLESQIDVFIALGDLQRLAAYFRSRHDAIIGDLSRASQLLQPLLEIPANDGLLSRSD
jgi:hypothetical protein